MKEKIILTTYESDSTTFSIRVSNGLLEKYNTMAINTRRSRNQIIMIAMQYFADHVEVEADGRSNDSAKT